MWIGIMRRLYRLALRLYPRDVRVSFGEDMERCFVDLVTDARERSGVPGAARAVVRTFAQLPAAAWDARFNPPTPPGWDRSPHQGRRLAGGNGWWRDVRYAGRGLLKNPGFAGLAVVSLALGIGANTTMLATVSSILWQSLPVPDAGQLMRVFQTDARGHHQVSFGNYLDVQEQGGGIFDGVTVHRLEAFGFRAEAESQVVYGELVGSPYFRTIGVEPALGRFFHAADDRTGVNEPVIVISHHLWQAAFGEAPDVVGTVVRLNDSPFTIIGVAPDGFNGTKFGLGMDLWVPVRAWALARGWSDGWDQARGSRSWLTVGRLKPGLDREQGMAALDPISARLREVDPDINRDMSLSLFDEMEGSIAPGTASVTRVAGAAAIGASVLVLLVACANVASLLLARAFARRREIGIRYALGVGRGRLVRGLLTESLLLASVGGAVGVAMAFWTGRLVLRWTPDLPYRMAIDPAPDPGIVGIAAFVCVAAAFLFGLAPALQASSVSPVTALKTGDGAEGRKLTTLRGLNLVVVSMVALSFVSLAVTGLFVRSLDQLRRVDPGFDTADRVIIDIDASLGVTDQADREDYFRRLVDRVTGLPGVESAGLIDNLPLGDRSSGSTVFADARTYDADDLGLDVWRATVSADYFEAAGTQMRRGRAFRVQDGVDDQPVVIVNETMAARLWPGIDPIGRRVRYGREPGDASSEMEVVGLVADGRYLMPNESPRPAMFRPLAQEPSATAVLVVAASGDLGQLVSAVRATAHEIDPSVPLLSVRTMRDHFRSSLWMFRLAAGVGLGLGGLALVLAAAGLYGVMAYSVRRRTKEMGIRIALGARKGQLLGLVFRRGGALALVGTLVGLAAAIAASTLLSSILFGVRPVDPLTMTAVALLLWGVTIVAILVPALAASRSDPVSAIRTEG